MSVSSSQAAAGAAGASSTSATQHHPHPLSQKSFRSRGASALATTLSPAVAASSSSPLVRLQVLEKKADFSHSAANPLTNNPHSLLKPGLFLGGYLAWVFAFKLLILSLMTYGSMTSSAGDHQLQEISELYESNEIGVMALATLTFLGFLGSLGPLSQTRLSGVFPREEMEQYFLPGLLKGVLLGLSFVALFLCVGIYGYFGPSSSLEEAPLTLANTILRMIALFGWVMGQAFIFRKKILPPLLEHTSPKVAAHGIALLATLVQCLHFNLSWMHFINLYLLNLSPLLLTPSPLAPTLQAKRLQNAPSLAAGLAAGPTFIPGAAFLSGLLIVLHPVFSLPILGNDFSGLLLVKYQPEWTTHLLALYPHGQGWLRYIHGGMGGPLASLALSLLLTAWLVLRALKVSLWQAYHRRNARRQQARRHQNRLTLADPAHTPLLLVPKPLVAASAVPLPLKRPSPPTGALPKSKPQTQRKP